ncbi:peroxiredoxin family protein [Virgibacillus necropolis]|uniref:Thioredoxin family protein n=1 Tax=Virgibacillus necropolis TaxID=163877 RepID=A0A221MAY1_9BACI|nr:TlpA disulfide reductase family protein [Virgibacillus necropolis]ASN04787.1 thioredoxin family protein [Virgibacillus necropolis]
MPGWQEFYQKYKNENFELLSVSVDIQGAEVAKPYAQDMPFTTVVDTENKLANLFGFKIVPNGIFIDKNGTIRLIKQGFQVTNDEHVESVRKLIFGEVEKIELDDQYYNPVGAASNVETMLAQTKYKLGMEYANNGKKEDALKELDEALLLDTDNFLIRKQRWYIRYPEKFSPTIDTDWQQKQLEKEKAEEAQLKDELICGPEGCVIPGTFSDTKK